MGSDRPGMHRSRTGRVEAIFVAAGTGSTAVAVDRVAAAAGRGLVGDRYFDDPPVASPGGRRRSQVTLIALEVVASLAPTGGRAPDPAALRRNILTTGLDLDRLVGETFTVGGVVMRALEVCEPCARVADAVGDRRLLRRLVGRGGVRAEVLSDGIIRVGDAIAPGKPSAVLA